MFTEVPLEYFCQTDANGQRHDIDQRPELKYGSVEYLAPQEYMVSVFPLLQHELDSFGGKP
jgi:protein transport protein SEC24